MSTNPGSPAAGGAGDARRQRLRDQMKAFYGDPNASAKRTAAQTSSQGNPNVPPELDLDSEYFNVNRYTTDLLKRESLKGLVETDTELLRRVRRLDGELQELVYRNYARFISATDTIREMKDNVVEMDAKLQTLSQNVNTIDGISSQISQQLQVHRSHIEETITANRMLKKVQFLTSLPTTMRRLIDKEEYNVGVKYWVAGDGFLMKHKSIGSITQIQQSCCHLAGELYRAIEQRMCSYPLDDPDAMDRIRGYVEDLRLLRATSLFESEHMADQPPFEEAVLHTLMKSVMASFQANVATTQRSLKSVLLLPEDIRGMDPAKREASLASVNLREPLAQLKNACAMLAVNSERVYALLDVESGNGVDASTAASRVSKDIQPVLVSLLQPVGQTLVEFATAHLDAIAMDGGSVMRDAAASAGTVQSATTHIIHLLRDFVTAMKTLAEIYLSPAAGTADKTWPKAGGSGVVADPVVLYDNQVHDMARAVLQQLHDRVRERVLQNPTPEVLQACVPVPVANTSIISALPSSDDAHTQRLAFVLTRLLYASMAQCTCTAIRTALVGEDGVPVEVVAALAAGFERIAQQLQHRAILLLGQLEVQSVYAGAFAGSSVPEASAAARSTTGPVVPAVLLQLLPEWATVYDAVKALPPITPAVPSNVTGRGGMPSSSASLRRRETSFSPSTNPGVGPAAAVGYRGAYGGGGGSSNGAPSDARGGSSAIGGSSAHPKAGGKLAVAYTRQVMASLQLSVNNIFANTEAFLRTEPPAGPPSAVMACVVRYVLQGVVDRVRDEVAYTEAQFQRCQVSCTFLLYALLSPAKGTAPRQWRKEWSDDDFQQVQRLMDEACICAYDRYEAKVPLSSAVLDRVVEAAVKGGRAAVLNAGADPTPAASPLLPDATVDADMAAAGVIPVPVSAQRHSSFGTAANNTTSAPAPLPTSQPQRHDDPLQSPQSSSTKGYSKDSAASSASSSANTSVSGRQSVAPAAPAPAPAVKATPASAPAPAPASIPLRTISQPPASVSPPRFTSAAAPAPPPQPSNAVRPSASAAAVPSGSNDAAYYNNYGTRVTRTEEDEELPM